MIELPIYDQDYLPDIFVTRSNPSMEDQIFSKEFLEWAIPRKVLFKYRTTTDFIFMNPADVSIAIFNSTRAADDRLVFDDISDAMMFRLTW